MWRSCLAITAVLAGCATTEQARVLGGNDRSVIVFWATTLTPSSEAALPVADAHCRKFGRKARYSRPAGDFKTAFDCVE